MLSLSKSLDRTHIFVSRLSSVLDHFRTWFELIENRRITEGGDSYEFVLLFDFV